MAKAQFTTSLLDILQSVVGPVGKDISEGEGEPVLCGQKVTVSYAEFLDGKQIFATPQDAPLTFTVGNGEVMKGLEIGVIGMKKGGERHILVPPAFGHDDPRFHRDDVKPNIKTDLDVKLDEYKPGYITTKNGMGIKIYDDADGHTKLAYCGNKVIVDYKIWDMDGKLLASTLIKDPENKDKPSKEEPGHGRFKETIAQPVIWQLGNGKAPYAFDIGITGDGSKHAMKVGGKRTIIAPANFLKTMTGGKPSADILEAKLPNKTLLIELELRDLSN